MPDENRFAGLGDQLDSDDESADVDDTGDDSGTDATDATDVTDADETASASSSAADSDGSSQSDAASESSSEQTPDSDDTASTGESTPESGPAFAFDDTQAKSLYVRPETVELLEDAEFEVESILRREHGIRDLTGREFHDALVRAVAANPEAVAEFVVDAREE